MSRSNWTLRFPRTSREAFGHPWTIEDTRRAHVWDKAIYRGCAAVLLTIIGLLILRAL